MKPKVICHVMASVDGHLQVERWTAPHPVDSRSDVMKAYPEIGRSLHTDAWTFGRNTVREIFTDRTDIFPLDSKDGVKDSPVMQESVYAAERQSERLFISFDPESDIIYTSSHLRGDDILAVLSMRTATPRYLSLLRGMGISYLVVDDFYDLRSVLERVNESFGVTSISLQGGGVLDGSMLNGGVVDELSLVVYPGLDGSKDSVSIFDGLSRQTLDRTSLELIDAKPQPHGSVWLHYRVHVKGPGQARK